MADMAARRGPDVVVVVVVGAAIVRSAAIMGVRNIYISLYIKKVRMGNNPGGVGANSFYVLPLAVLFVILLFLFFFVEKVLSSVGGARGNNSIGWRCQQCQQPTITLNFRTVPTIHQYLSPFELTRYIKILPPWTCSRPNWKGSAGPSPARPASAAAAAEARRNGT